MLFSLSNASVIFQGYVNKILAEKLDIFIIIYLNDLLIYIKNLGQPNVEAIYQILNQLPKYLLFANLKKCCFLRYIMSSKNINIKAKRIEIVKKWPTRKAGPKMPLYCQRH